MTFFYGILFGAGIVAAVVIVICFRMLAILGEHPLRDDPPPPFLRGFDREGGH